MRRLLSTAILAAFVIAAVVLTAAGGEGGDSEREYKIVFDNAFGLTEGGDFRVGGVTAGQTKSFEATDSSPPKAIVNAVVDKPGFGDFREDATCTIKPQSLIGEYYVDCQPGKSERKLPEGGTVPVEQTESTVPIDVVNNVLRRPYRERFRIIINELGTGLAGRPEDLQAVLKRAHPGLRETSKVLRILADQNSVIENFLADADTVVAELDRRKEDVSRFITEAGETAEISATRREELRQTFNRLPRFLGELRPTMARLGELADEQVPLLGDVETAAPSLERFIGLLGPFAEASRPAINSLGEASEVGSGALRDASNEIRTLRQLARNAPGTAKPLRQFLESLDDDRRAIDDDPRALVGGPPPTDPSNRNGGRGGFTGFEALWNYFFWQSLSINAFDSVSHVLRIGLTINKCSPYENDTPTRDPSLAGKFADCNQYLGPDQPGINTPDFTEGGATPQTLARAAEQPAAQVGERRAPGQPDAGPVPGQRDISKPQVTLPPQVQDLVDRLPKLDLPRLDLPGTTDRLNGLLKGEVPRGESGQPPTVNQLLDFLLAP